MELLGNANHKHADQLIAAARVNAFAGGSPGIQFQSMYGFKSGPDTV
jgi:hypothetical protein